MIILLKLPNDPKIVAELEVRRSDLSGLMGLAGDGLPDVIEFKGIHFVRVFDASRTPRYVKGAIYHAD